MGPMTIFFVFFSKSFSSRALCAPLPNWTIFVRSRKWSSTLIPCVLHLCSHVGCLSEPSVKKNRQRDFFQRTASLVLLQGSDFDRQVAVKIMAQVKHGCANSFTINTLSIHEKCIFSLKNRVETQKTLNLFGGKTKY